MRNECSELGFVTGTYRAGVINQTNLENLVNHDLDYGLAITKILEHKILGKLPVSPQTKTVRKMHRAPK